MTILLKFISIFIFIGALEILVANRKNKSGNIKKRNYAICGLLFSIFLFILSSVVVIIPTGYTGVRSTFGQIDSVTVQNGFNLKLPFVQSIDKVNNKQQDIYFENAIWSETSERTAVYFENITVTYQISPDKSAWIFANVSDYEECLINQSLVASAIKSSSKVLSDEDVTNRSLIEQLAMENIQKSLDEKYGENVIYVVKVVISNADFEESYNLAIAEKQQAQLAAEKQAIENQKAIEKAEADATVKTTTAEAEAAAKVISAEAEAEANELLERSLTTQILNKMWIEKWDGQLPKYVSDGTNPVMFDLDN